jgi:hypothetical protein
LEVCAQLHDLAVLALGKQPPVQRGYLYLKTILNTVEKRDVCVAG